MGYGALVLKYFSSGMEDFQAEAKITGQAFININAKDDDEKHAEYNLQVSRFGHTPEMHQSHEDDNGNGDQGNAQRTATQPGNED